MIRFAEKKDIPEIMDFINKYWKKNHILGVNKDFFEYEHVIDNNVTYVISKNENNEIDGIEGFIPYGKNNRDIMLVMWKANNSKNHMLGIQILKYIIENSNVRFVSCPGIGKQVERLYNYMGFFTGTMSHWYRLGENINFKIAKINNYNIPKINKSYFSIIKINSFFELTKIFDFNNYYKNNPSPLKEEWYIEKRYFNHPIYKYEVYGIINQDKINTILIFRLQPYNNSIALRLIDIIGKFNEIYNITTEIDNLLRIYNAEYIDFYEKGMDKEKMIEAGWILTKKSNNIIPNYFSPFLQENIDINYCTQDENIYLFKGDGDQDRPS